MEGPSDVAGVERSVERAEVVEGEGEALDERAGSSRRLRGVLGGPSFSDWSASSPSTSEPDVVLRPLEGGDLRRDFLLEEARPAMRVL